MLSVASNVELTSAACNWYASVSF